MTTEGGFFSGVALGIPIAFGVGLALTCASPRISLASEQSRPQASSRRVMAFMVASVFPKADGRPIRWDAQLGPDSTSLKEKQRRPIAEKRNGPYGIRPIDVAC